MSLKAKLVRLAHAHPEFQDALLPLLRKGSALRDLKVEVRGIRIVDVIPSSGGGIQLGSLGYLREDALTTPGDKALVYPTEGYAKWGDPVGFISKDWARKIYDANR